MIIIHVANTQMFCLLFLPFKGLLHLSNAHASQWVCAGVCEHMLGVRHVATASCSPPLLFGTC